MRKRFHLTIEAFALLLIVGVAVAWGHDGMRSWQVWSLWWPALFWLCWTGASPAHHRIRAGFVALWCALFILDGVFRSYLRTRYGAAPDSSHVLLAIANTQTREAWEYWTAYRADIAAHAMIALGAVLLCAWLSGRRGTTLPRGPLNTRPWHAAAGVLVALAVLMSVAGHLSKPWRRWHPAAFWTQWTLRVADLRYYWNHLEQSRSETLAEAQNAHPTVLSDQPSTVVLVIADSINRDNMQIYGYPRATTPLLAQRRQLLGNDLMVFRDAWSSKAGTLESLADLFEFGAPGSAATPHVLALARSAGYEVWWISNQDDLAIEQLHGQLAHERRMVNRTPGRSSRSLDTAVLQPLHEALNDPSARKLIVVHLLGAHPSYRLRYPDDMPTLAADGDAVDAAMAAQGRSWSLRRQRSEYDTAILFHDQVVAQTFDATLQSLGTSEYGAWMYLSDHGQQVGHDTDHAGHSFDTAAGYKIPALIWENQPHLTSSRWLAQRPFRADWAGWTITSLLNLQWKGYDASRDILSPAYRWRAPDAGFWPHGNPAKP